MTTGVPSNENRFFPLRISTQGKPCSGPVLTLYGIAVRFSSQLVLVPDKFFNKCQKWDQKQDLWLFH